MLFEYPGAGRRGPKDDPLVLYHELNSISGGQPQPDSDFQGYSDPASLVDGARIVHPTGPIGTQRLRL